MQKTLLPLIAAAALLAPALQASAAGTSTLSFQQGLNGYAGTQDAHIRSNETSGGDSRNTNYGALASLSIDGDDGSPGAKPNQGLIRFEHLFGSAAGQIKASDTIVSATLKLNVFDPGSGFTVHRLLSDWSQAKVTWNSLGNGVQLNGVEAEAAVLASFGANNGNANVSNGWLSIDLTQSLITQQGQAQAAFGWLLTPYLAGTNGVDFHSSESSSAALRPLLEVNVVSSVPEPQAWLLMAGGLLALVNLKRSRKA
ncbi:DNRLRE domain-containing protein [Roseateles sp. PN1]|uniref:DNRLRE domain-containing protein n=1 Tax=Roseateles sp. PN1 TaxID=3137372 RepID=UPI003138E087